MGKLKLKDENDQWLEVAANGYGVPSGGSQGDVLVKSSSTDYATEWALPLSMKLLWTNPNPSSNFAAQTVSLDLSNFDFVEIRYTGSEPMQRIPIDGNAHYLNSAYAVSGNSFYVATRTATASSTGITFTVARYCYRDGGNAENNTLLRPYQIYGIK